MCYAKCPESANRRWPLWPILPAVFLSFIVSFGGCGRPGPKGPVGTVHGKASVNSVAVPAGTVVSFVSEAGGVASGLAGTDGSFRLTSSFGDKVPVGNYKVLLMAASVESALTPEQQMEESMKAQQSGKTVAALADLVIPAKYGNVTTTPESRVVKEGDNEINIDAAP